MFYAHFGKLVTVASRVHWYGSGRELAKGVTKQSQSEVAWTYQDVDALLVPAHVRVAVAELLVGELVQDCPRLVVQLRAQTQNDSVSDSRCVSRDTDGAVFVPDRQARGSRPVCRAGSRHSGRRVSGSSLR